MDTLELKDAVEHICLQNGLEKNSVVDVLVDTIISEFSEYLNILDSDLQVELDENYKINLAIKKEVVEEVEDEMIEMTVAEAQKINESAALDEKIAVPIDFSILDRRNIKKLNSVLMQKIRNIHKEVLYREYLQKEGQLVSGTFLRRSGRDIFVDIGRTEAKLPYRDQSPREFYKQGDKVKTYLKEVLLDENNRLFIHLSRTDPNLVKKLFELEVPEVAEGVVKIKSIVRETGFKTKMTVFSNKMGVEPVGACVGLAGIRIKAVIKELGGEKIDVIPYSTNVKEFIARAMQPATVQNVLIIDNETKEALVVVDDASYPLAIGKNGINIKLASRLTDWKINLKTETQIQKHPEILKIFSKAENIFSTDIESDLHQLTDVNEEVIVKLMTAGIMSVSELYEKNVDELSKVEGVTKADAEAIRKTLDEMVEIVDDEEAAERSREEYMNEFEDEISGVDTEEQLEEEIQQVEYLVCPSCGFEFEYTGQEKCPSCNVAFEFEEEVEEEVVEE